MRVLDLGCGTKSVKTALERIYGEGNYEYVGVDIEAKFNPEILADICDMDISKYEPFYFDVVWASPPCTEYSAMKYFRGVRDLAKADRIAKRCIEIIEELKPKWFFVENPRWGLLPDRPFMQPYRHLMQECCYCKYGDLHKKPTAIFTNRDVRLEYCRGENRCEAKKELGRHKHGVKQGRSEWKYEERLWRKVESARVPQPLLDVLLAP
jgi:SAM-dependent methyltransferase